MTGYKRRLRGLAWLCTFPQGPPHKLARFGQKMELRHQRDPGLFDVPAISHDSMKGMSICSEQKVAQFMGDDASEHGTGFLWRRLTVNYAR